MSPSSRGRGLKYLFVRISATFRHVALFTRAWIEMELKEKGGEGKLVALFTRAWIEICTMLVI